MYSQLGNQTKAPHPFRCKCLLLSCYTLQVGAWALQRYPHSALVFISWRWRFFLQEAEFWGALGCFPFHKVGNWTGRVDGISLLGWPALSKSCCWFTEENEGFRAFLKLGFLTEDKGFQKSKRCFDQHQASSTDWLISDTRALTLFLRSDTFTWWVNATLSFCASKRAGDVQIRKDEG